MGVSGFVEGSDRVAQRTVLVMRLLTTSECCAM